MLQAHGAEAAALPRDFDRFLKEAKVGVREDTGAAVSPHAPLLIAGHMIFGYDLPLMATVCTIVLLARFACCPSH